MGLAIAVGRCIGKRLISGNLLGRTICELDVRKVYGINVIAVERDHRTDVEFAADYRFAEGDTVSEVGKVEKIDRFERVMPGVTPNKNFTQR